MDGERENGPTRLPWVSDEKERLFWEGYWMSCNARVREMPEMLVCAPTHLLAYSTTVHSFDMQARIFIVC